MARNHARILTKIWDDDDFLAMASGAQRTYLMLLSQPDLSLCGVLDYNPKRLARLAPDVTAMKVERAIGTLEARRFVIVDRETDELAVRTFLRHDGVLDQPNVLKAAARSWNTIHSRSIRGMVVETLPPSIRVMWPDALVKMDPKVIAQKIRDHKATEGLPPTLPGTLQGNPSPEAIGEPPGIALDLSPTPPPDPSPEAFPAQRASQAEPDTPPASAAAAAEPEEDLWTLLAHRRATLLQAQDGDVRGPRWITVTAADYAGRLEPRRRLLVGQHPDWTNERLADELDPDTAERDWSQPTADEGDAYIAELEQRAAEAVPMPPDMRADLTARLEASPHRRRKAAGE